MGNQGIVPLRNRIKSALRASAAFVADMLRRSGFWKGVMGSGGSRLRWLAGNAGRMQGNLTKRAAAVYSLVRIILVLTLIALVLIIAIGIITVVKLLATL